MSTEKNERPDPDSIEFEPDVTISGITRSDGKSQVDSGQTADFTREVDLNGLTARPTDTTPSNGDTLDFSFTPRISTQRPLALNPQNLLR